MQTSRCSRFVLYAISQTEVPLGVSPCHEWTVPCKQSFIIVNNAEDNKRQVGARGSCVCPSASSCAHRFSPTGFAACVMTCIGKGHANYALKWIVASPDQARDLQQDWPSGTRAVPGGAGGPSVPGTTGAAALTNLPAQVARQTAVQLVGMPPAAHQSNDATHGSPFDPKPYPAPVLPSASARGPLSPSSRLGSASGGLPPLLQGWGALVREPTDPGGTLSQLQGWGSPVRGTTSIGGTIIPGGSPALPQGWALPPGAAGSRAQALPSWAPAHVGGWLSPPSLLSPPAGSMHPVLLVRAGSLGRMAS